MGGIGDFNAKFVQKRIISSDNETDDGSDEQSGSKPYEIKGVELVSFLVVHADL